MVFSSSYIFAQEKMGDGFFFLKKQFLFSMIGFIGMLVLSQVHYGFFEKYSYLILILAVLILAATLIPGVGLKVGGAQRWVHFFGLQFQPSELLKIALVIAIAKRLAHKYEKIHQFTAGVLGNFLVLLPALVLLMSQPDFGTTAVICAVVFVLMFVAGVPFLYLFATSFTALSVLASLIYFSPYRLARFQAFLDPWSDPLGKGFQILQSFIGLQEGGIFGIGLGNGKEKLFFLPEAHNDFIFSVIGEELGFLGVMFVVVLFSCFVFRGLKIGWNSLNDHDDRFGFLLAVGITMLIGLQAFINMAVVVGALPTKGLTLPFISYGGSSILMNLLAVGILLSVSKGPKLVSVRKG